MIESIFEYIKDVATYPPITLIGAVTLIDIAPIKLNPWKWLLSKIGDVITGQIRSDLAELKRDFEETKAQDKRWHILTFANGCRNGKLHSKEEWQHVISELAEYEAYTERKDITNGVIEEETKFLRELYHERCIKNDFL